VLYSSGAVSPVLARPAAPTPAAAAYRAAARPFP
jgi:hypothetical protein